jgi:hypothetical protein
MTANAGDVVFNTVMSVAGHASLICVNLRSSAVKGFYIRVHSCPFAVVFLRVLCVSVVKLSGYERLGYTVSGREGCFCR